MKSKKTLALAGLALLVVAAAVSCQKSRYCLCVSQKDHEPQDTMIVNVDNDMNCKNILQLGIMVQDSGNLKIDSIYHFTCTKLHKDSLGNYNNLHLNQ